MYELWDEIIYIVSVQMPPCQYRENEIYRLLLALKCFSLHDIGKENHELLFRKLSLQSMNKWYKPLR